MQATCPAKHVVQRRTGIWESLLFAQTTYLKENVVQLSGECSKELSEGYERHARTSWEPQRFIRIRHYGILSSSWKRGKLQDLQQKLKVPPPVVVMNTKLRKCPCCKTGTMITIEIIGKRGPPEKHIAGQSNCNH